MLESLQYPIEIINTVFIFHQVVQNVGLCIALWDIVERGESFMFPGMKNQRTHYA